MIQKNKIKYNFKENKNSEINNQRRQNLKNIYHQMKRKINTTYSQKKLKNRLTNMKKTKLTENLSKKSENNNINLLYNKQSEESRNNNKSKLIKYNDEDILNDEMDIPFNKTEKDIQLLYNKNNSKIPSTYFFNSNFDIKRNEKEKDLLNKKINYYSNKDANEIKDKKMTINNNFLFKNKKMNSNIDLKTLNMTNKNKFQENNDTKNKQNSFEKIHKLMINKKIIQKNDYKKTKNLFEKLNSARLTNNEINKLNLKKYVDSEIKTISNKNTSRISSQKLGDLKEKELDLGKMKKIKKSKIIKQITKHTNKNHSMTINDSKKKLLLNDTLKDNINVKIEKSSLVNLYNYPTMRNNIPKNKNYIIDSMEQENSGNNIKNDLSNLNCTCFNFNNETNMNSTFNNNLNGTFNLNINKKQTPNKYHYHNNSFNKIFSQISFNSKPVARLKKRIFDSSSDKKNDNSINNIENICDIDKNELKENDSLEINKKENNNIVIKELLITIKALNQIIKTQKKIIEEYMIKERELKSELGKKDKEIINYKNTCLKLMFYLKDESEYNTLKETNKKRRIIENQIIKENQILKELIIIPKINLINKDENNYKNDFDITSKKFYKANINENGNTLNFYKENILKSNDINFEKGDNSFNPLFNIEIINNQLPNKKREKSYENRKKKRTEKNV